MSSNQVDRRGTLFAGLATVGALIGGAAAAQTARSRRRASVGRDDAAFGRTDEDHLNADDATLPRRARELVRIGNIGIAREDQAAMAAFFHPQFRFHGPGGAELDREGLWKYFAACRAAFDDFSVTRQALMSDGDLYMASRTRFAGTFARAFTGLGGAPIPPNGRRIEYRVVNIFRYAPDGRLAEEWVQYDRQAFEDQLRARA